VALGLVALAVGLNVNQLVVLRWIQGGA
jgi:hypothetical protein